MKPENRWRKQAWAGRSPPCGVQVPARSTINKEGITMKNKSLYLIILLAGVVLFGLFTVVGALVSDRGSASLAVESDTINIKVILSENNGENPIVYYFKLSKDTNYT